MYHEKRGESVAGSPRGSGKDSTDVTTPKLVPATLSWAPSATLVASERSTRTSILRRRKSLTRVYMLSKEATFLDRSMMMQLLG